MRNLIVLLIGLILSACSGAPTAPSVGNRATLVEYETPCTTYSDNNGNFLAQFYPDGFPQFSISQIYRIDCIDPGQSFLAKSNGVTTFYSGDFSLLMPIYELNQPNVTCGTNNPYDRYCASIKVYVAE